MWSLVLFLIYQKNSHKDMIPIFLWAWFQPFIQFLADIFTCMNDSEDIILHQILISRSDLWRW